MVFYYLQKNKYDSIIAVFTISLQKYTFFLKKRLIFLQKKINKKQMLIY